MKTIKTSLFALVIASPCALLYNGCELQEGCNVNSQCGQDFLCRDNECLPRCVTYLTCAEGEACVDGACQVPSADYCDYIAPANAPDGGLYLPCEVVGGVMMMSGGTGAPAGGATAGAPNPGGESAAGAQTAGVEASGGAEVLSPVGGGPASDAGTDTPDQP